MKRLYTLWLYFRLGLLFRDVPPEERRDILLRAMIADRLEKYSRTLRGK
jgi:hypothetical protein